MSAIATVRFSRHEGVPTLDVTVPRGTLPSQLAALNEHLTKEFIPRVTGHQTCYSGVDFRLREEAVESVIKVDLATGRVAEGGPQAR
jgi:hypothetical protein